MERMVGDWCLGSPIGSGSFAIVWKARHRVTGQESAIKEINLDKLNAKLGQSLESEVSILKRINHDNIVKLLEVFEEKSKLYLIMEYCAGGDLAHYIRAHKRVPEAVAQHFMQQLAAGLREMWAHHLVHRDLKPQNLLLEGPGPSARLKIADFGFARNLQPQGLAETLCGSPLYMAPEILHFHKYDAKADLWSVGAILFELVAGRPPFNGANQLQLLRNIERGEARLPDVVATQLSLPCRQLIHALLRRNPVERISFEEFFRHPFLTGPPPPAPPPSPFGLPGQLGRSASANSIPQQVLGFKQQAAPVGTGEAGVAGGLPGTGGMCGGGPAAAPLAPPVVGQLSNQLKPRRSLDLDGMAQRVQQAQQAQQAQQLAGRRPAEAGQQRWAPAPAQLAGTSAPVRELAGASTLGAQLAALSAHHQYQQQQQQQQQQQNGRQGLGNGWAQQFGMAGGLGRPTVSQYPQFSSSVGLGRAAPFTQPGSAPANVQPLLLTPFPPHPLAQQGTQAGQPARAGPAELKVPVPAVPSPPRPPAAGSAAAGPAVPTLTSAAAPPGAQSAHSIDDDYVLVDTVLSSRNGQHSPAPPTSPPASATNSLASSLHTRPVDEVFTVGAAGEAACCGGGEGEATGASGPSPAWLPSAGTPRWQLLRRAAHAMEHLCGPAKPEQQPAQCLSLCLAALQLLEHALDSLPAPAPGGGGNGTGSRGSVDSAAPVGTAAGAVAAAATGLGDRSESRLREDVARVLSRAQAAAAALARQAGAAAGNGREGPNISSSSSGGDSKASPQGPAQGSSGPCQAAAATLPDPWELCYSCSLALAKEAAVDELLGNLERSLQLYAKACYLLHFMCVDGPELALEPPLQLTRQDRARLQRYAAATSARWAACKGQVGGEQAPAAPAVVGM